MSNFTCGHCGTEIVEDDEGYYTTECEHYPLKLSNLAKRSPILALADILAGAHSDTPTAKKVLEIKENKKMEHRKDALYKVDIKTPKGVRVKLDDVDYVTAFAVCESLRRDGSSDPELVRILTKCTADFGFSGIFSGEYRVNISAYLPVTDTGEAHTCGSRQATAAGSQENPDTWRLIGKDKVCSYCGSLHPERVRELVQEHGLGVLEPSTKSYKWYVTRRDVPNALFGGIKYYRWHDTPAFLAAIKSLSALEEGE